MMNRLICFTCILLSCNIPVEPKLAVDRNTIVLRDIPIRRQTTDQKKINKKTQSLAGLEELEDGFHDLQIRVWFSNGSDRDKLILIQNIGNKWLGKMMTLEYIYLSSITPDIKAKDDSLVNVKVIQRQITPKSNWKNVLDSLIYLGIFSLPDMELLDGYDTGTDGRNILVEVASINTYRVYGYHEPESHSSKFWEAGKINEIAGLMQREFDLENKK